MFFTYLRRELRRRMRQAVFIALGLALGIGLVITVSAASDGVKNSQASVLHSLYGVGTDITITQPPAQGSNAATSFGFRQDIRAVRSGQIASGTSINLNHLANSAYGTLGAGSVATVAGQHGVSGAAGGLTLTDVTVTGSVPSLKAGQGSFSSSFTTNSFTVDGVDLAGTALGPLAHEVNTIYVSADSAADIPTVQRRLATVLPHATVTDQSDLASQVTGSLSSASSLASNLGTWLSAAVLIAAFGLAVVLTMAAVTRRVREFGTLKALGWRSRRIIGQVMGESITTGLIGGAAGVGLGYAGAALIDTLAPPLSATLGSPGLAGTPGRALSPGASSALQTLTSTSHTVSVSLSAPVTLGVILLAVLLAIAGGLVAGSFGGWRAARLRPADALARVE